MADFLNEARAMLADLVRWRRDFHRHPETRFEEVWTSRRVAEHLSALGLEVVTGIGKTGVVGILEGDAPGPTVMLRFDMDALPIQEENQSDYVSQVPGKMHACGHDSHMAMGMGVASLLTQHRRELAGRVKFIFQPAEEGAGGAKAMIDDGALASPRPDFAFGLHIWTPLPSGKVVIQPGPLMAAVDKFTIRLQGRGGHGAMPHETVDTVVVGAQIVSALQSIVARNVNPASTAVVSIGIFHAGTTFNIIPGSAELVGGTRSFDETTRRLLTKRINAVAHHTAEAFGARAEVTWEALAPPLINDETETAYLRAVAADLIGAENITRIEPEMVSEDMAEFLNRVPGSFFFLGCRNEATQSTFPHHNPRFAIDEAVMPMGVAILAEATARKLR